jgi:hypothetical protein
MGPLDQDPASQSESGSGSRRAKMTHKIGREKINKFIYIFGIYLLLSSDGDGGRHHVSYNGFDC